MQKANGHITEVEARNFISLEGERFVLGTRKHWFTLFFALTTIILSTLLAIMLSFSLFAAIPFFSSKISLFISSAVVMLTFSLSLVVKAIVDWYFHLYIITTRKLIEIFHSPLSTLKINEVLLDKVRCTEVDVQVNGFFNEFIDKGNVMVTFDRPTHQEEFVLEDINDPEEVSILLSDAFDRAETEKSHTAWYKEKNGNGNRYRMREEIFPNYV